MLFFQTPLFGPLSSLIEDACAIRADGLPQLTYTQVVFNPPVIEIDSTMQDSTLMQEAEMDTTSTEPIVNFYPNPSDRGVFYYDNRSMEIPAYFIYDRWGKLIKSGEIYSSGEVLLLDNDPGLYFLTIQTEAYGRQTYKLLKT